MRVVGLDLETTSLEATEGEIIEVACIAYDFESGEELDRFVQLCSTTSPLTEEITTITGITPDMIADEPHFDDVKERVQEFLGDDIVFAHNARFDVGWLREHGVTVDNPVWDTFPLASIALPMAPSYNLGQLIDHFGLKREGEHRAGDDVEMTWGVLQQLQPLLVLSDEWRGHGEQLLKRARLDHYWQLFTDTPKLDATPPPRSGETPPLDKGRQSVSEIFSEKGPLAKSMKDWKGRAVQVEMAEKIERVTQEGGVQLIEAGTGTGKSYAYLVPLLFREERDRPALVSTHTRHLQDQLVESDLPQLMGALEIDRAIATLKGRANYLCGTRLSEFLRSDHFSHEEAMIGLKLLVWLSQGGNGDLSRLNFSHQERPLRALHAESIRCAATCKPGPASECWYQLARAQARAADIVVVNHALLARLSTTEEPALPVETHVVVDEAHHLAEVTRRADEVRHSVEQWERLWAPIGKLVPGARDDATEFIRVFRQWWNEQVGRAAARELSDTTWEWRVSAVRAQSPEWQEIAALGAELVQSGQEFLEETEEKLSLITKKDDRDLAGMAIVELKNYLPRLAAFITADEQRICWLAQKPDDDLVGWDVPYSVVPLLDPLWQKVRSATLTSATLAVGDSFDYVTTELGLREADTTQLATPFNYDEQLMVYVVTDLPDPKAPTWRGQVGHAVEVIAQTLSGRTLGLFTSKKAVSETFNLVNSSLYKQGIKVFAQGRTGGKFNMTKRFTELSDSVLLGTSSFWEGLNVVGESLSGVVIPKLPFPNPFDPIMEALGERAEQERTDGRTDWGYAFRVVSIPMMILQLRQGMGRVIRGEQDKGVVILLDPRIDSKPYGRDVKEALPTATVRTGKLADLPAALADWFGSETIDRWSKEHSQSKK